MSTTRSSFYPWIAAVSLAAWVTISYWGSLGVPWLFDDAGAVSNNPTIRSLASLDVFAPPSDGSTTTGRPVVNFSFAINYAFSGENAWSYHAVNLVIHMLAALTLMGIVRATLTSPILLGRFDRCAHALALWAAILWAVHPLQTETVICVAQRTESLCALFYLLTLYGFVRGAREGGRQSRGWFTLSLVSSLLGMGTKEVMATAPLMVMLYDRTFIAGSFLAAWRRRSRYYCGLASTWLLLVILVAREEGARGASAGFGLGVSGWTYLLKQCEALCVYLKLVVWPHPLVLDYGTDVVDSLAGVWWQGPLVLALLGATAWALVRKPILGFVGAWFFVVLAPSSSVIPLVAQTMAEHRMYLPLAAIIGAAAAFGHVWSCRWSMRLMAGIALLLVVLTINRTLDYRDEMTIWRDTAKKRPNNARAHNNLALALQRQGQAEEANKHYSEATRLQSDYISARYNWGVALLEQGRPADAVVQLGTAVRLAPNHADARINLGNALMKTGRISEAIAQYEAALKQEPAADARSNLSIALAAAGQRAEQEKRLDDAERFYAEAIQLAPETFSTRQRLGLLMARSGKLTLAAEQFRAILRAAPNDADALANLGNVLLLAGDARNAIDYYEQALQVRPADARARENLQLAREAARAGSR